VRATLPNGTVDRIEGVATNGEAAPSGLQMNPWRGFMRAAGINRNRFAEADKIDARNTGPRSQ
jgi:hypothetical protein